jgi:lysophospholipase L1-like esterase
MHSLRKRIPIAFILSIMLVFTLAPVTLTQAHSQTLTRVGPKTHYLALGDSLGFGFQPNLDFDDGYANDFFTNLKTHGTTTSANLSCPGETSVTFLSGKCPFPLLRKFPYIGSQMNAAVNYLNHYKGQVSPVTLDIGANDVNSDLDTKTCTTNLTQFNTDLATLDTNLTTTILPQLKAAMTVNGQMTGDIVIMNYYDPSQNICPNSVLGAEELNQHLANDIVGFGTIVDVFSAFGGATTPNPNICNFTWMCSIFKNIHASDQGYRVIASTFESGIGY